MMRYMNAPGGLVTNKRCKAKRSNPYPNPAQKSGLRRILFFSSCSDFATTHALTRASILWLFRTFTSICVLPLTASYRTPNGPDLRSAGAAPAGAASAMVG